MLIHASEAETLNSIRFALEREEQQIRVNDGTGEVYDITISRSAPYASPVVSRTATPSNVGGEPAHTSTTSGGHRILRLPQLVSKRTHAVPNGTVPRPSTEEKPLPVLLESSQSSTSGAASDTQQASSSSSSYTAPTRHHPFLSELPPSPPLEADYVAGHDSRNGLINSLYNNGQQPTDSPHHDPRPSPKVPKPRRAYTADLVQSISSPDGQTSSPERFTAEPMQMQNGSPTTKSLNLQQRRFASNASSASTAYRTASSHGGSESDSEHAGASSSRTAHTADHRGASEPPAIRLTHDTSPYSHNDSTAAETSSVNPVNARQNMPRRNTTGSPLQGSRGGNGTTHSRRSSRERDPAFGSGGHGLPSGQMPTSPTTDIQNSPTTDVQNLALRTGDAAFDQEAAKHADQLRRDRRYKEQKARDAAAEEEQADGDPANLGGTLTRSRTGRDWRLREKEREEEMEPKVLVGNLVGEGHANYALMYNMLTGIRIGVSRCQAKTKRTLCDADFTAKHKITFDIIGNELTPTAKYDFKFKDYAPWVFRELREHFYLDAADYLLSLTSKYILSELGSPGKSGSFFYFSRDYRFIIKTIRHQEHKFLLRILKDYHEHVKANPHTLLSRFYGLHRVKLPHGRKIHFVIMNNLFPPHRDVHETYDLKGSSIGREYPEDKAAAKKGAVLKDLNWLNRGREIELGPEKRALFEAQLRSDVALLQRLNIMDYSLLIGLHDMRRGNKENLRQDNLRVFQPETKDLKRQPTQVNRGGATSASEKDASALRQAVRRSDPKALNAQQVTKLPDRDVSERRHFLFYQDEGGFRSTDESNQPGHMIYYLGVIDLFTPYTYVKRGETIWKGLRQNRHMISSVPPKEYGQRFFDFLVSVVTGGDKSRMPKMWGFPRKKSPPPPAPSKQQ